jgi:hypothetical protein
MTTTIDTTEQKVLVREAIAQYIAFMNEASIKHTEKNFPMLKPDTYECDGGRKYIRIVSGHSVHSFVDALTGDVYMAAGFAKPMLNGARYNLLDEASFADLKAKWDPYGGYLYKARAAAKN